MKNSGENDLDFDDMYLQDYVIPFTPGKVYLADSTGLILGEYDSFIKAKLEAEEGDVILSAYNYLGSHIPLATEKKCDKIVVDFAKKELTIGNKDVTLAKVQYEKDAVYDLEMEDLKDWEDLLKDARSAADEVEIIGVPPINAKDITDEMSDL